MDTNKEILKIEGTNSISFLNEIERIFKVTAATINPPKEEQPEFITRQQVADLFGITLPTVHAWMHAGILTAYKIGNKTRFRKSEVLAACKPLKSPKHG
ncbi:MAG TPA: helix-turn-helix domain-containing protein [Niabella sp.]|nr:helix-turn-helix domain-containing protein [Niabella sp.]